MLAELQHVHAVHVVENYAVALELRKLLLSVRRYAEVEQHRVLRRKVQAVVNFVRVVPDLLLQNTDSLDFLALELLPGNALVQARVSDSHAIRLAKHLLGNTYYLWISRLGVVLCIITFTTERPRIRYAAV